MKKLILLASLALLAAGCNTQTGQNQGAQNNQPQQQTGSDQGAQSGNNPQTLITYKNQTYGFQFDYPAQYEFVTPSYASLQDKVVELTTPRNAYPNTNFADARFSVSASSAKSLAACLALPADERGGFAKSPTKINGVDFYRATTSGAAAGNLYDSTIYRTWGSNKPCLELKETIHTANIGNFEPGTVTEVNQQPIRAELDEITNSFKFLSQ